jgi:hypothetical protein
VDVVMATRRQYLSGNARRNEKRAEREKQYELEDAIRRAEEARVKGLSMWERIEECTDDEKLRDVLHRIATHCGAER